MEPSPWLMGIMLITGLLALYWVLFGQRKAQQESEGRKEEER